MRNNNQIKVNRERGAATIEAIISFMGFLFVIFTIFSIMNVCRVQMLVSNAVDTATKELTQYSYFYKMSGLQKFSSELSATAETGKTNLNEVIGTVDQLYTSVGTAIDTSIEHGKNIKDAIESGDVNVDIVQNAIRSIESDATNVESAINSITDAFGDVMDNPILYMKSLVAVAGNEGLDLLKSHIIAAPLAELFVSKHFGTNKTEADKNLEALGVVDGLDGMNFKMSTLFASDSPEDVHIVVYYKIKVMQLFDWIPLEIPLCKESVARGWLAGDDVQARVKPAEAPTPEETPEATPEANPDGSPEVTPEENPEVTPGTEEDVPSGLWAMEEGPRLVAAALRYGFKLKENSSFFVSIRGNEDVVYFWWPDTSAQFWWEMDYIEQEDGSYMNSGVNDLTLYLNMLLQLVNGYMMQEDASDITKAVYVMFVPDNMPEDQRNRLFDDIVILKRLISEGNPPDGLIPIPDGLEIDIQVKAGTGNYDYEN